MLWSLDNLEGVLRAAPAIYIMNALFGWMSNTESIFYFIYLCLIEVASWSLKKFSMKVLGEDSEIGSRPIGAKNCGSFILPHNCNLPSTSYGMPSGHAIIATAVSLFEILRLGGINDELHIDNFKAILWLVFGSAVIISRVYYKCHTVLQVIVGIGIGLVFGYLMYLLTPKVIYDEE